MHLYSCALFFLSKTFLTLLAVLALLKKWVHTSEDGTFLCFVGIEKINQHNADTEDKLTLQLNVEVSQLPKSLFHSVAGLIQVQ